MLRSHCHQQSRILINTMSRRSQSAPELVNEICCCLVQRGKFSSSVVRYQANPFSGGGMPPEPPTFQSFSFKSVLMPQIEIAEREGGEGVNRLLSRQKKKKKL